jgi:hypothetical protein
MEAIEQFFSRISYGKVLKALSSLFFVSGVALLLKGTMVPELYPSPYLVSERSSSP